LWVSSRPLPTAGRAMSSWNASECQRDVRRVSGRSRKPGARNAELDCTYEPPLSSGRLCRSVTSVAKRANGSRRFTISAMTDAWLGSEPLVFRSRA
jgi:hypothetical protein